jgi:signal transduction histidine kinase
VNRVVPWALTAAAAAVLAASHGRSHVAIALGVTSSCGLVYLAVRSFVGRTNEWVVYLVTLSLVLGGGAWIGEFDIALSIGLLATYALHAVAMRAVKQAVREHNRRAALASVLELDRRMRRAIADVERAIAALLSSVRATRDEVTPGRVGEVGAAGQVLRRSLAGATGEVRPAAPLDERAETASEAHVRRLRRNLPLAILKSELLVTSICVALMIALGLLVPSAELDPWPVAICFYGHVACYPLYRRGWQSAPLVAVWVYSLVFTAATALFVARTSPSGALGYSPALIGLIVGLAENYRVTPRRPFGLVANALGVAAVAPFARGDEQLVTLIAAGCVGLVCAILQGPSVERTDARRDAEDRLKAAFARDKDAHIRAVIAARRGALADVLGRAHDAASPLLALNALGARGITGNETRARELLGSLEAQLATIAQTPLGSVHCDVAEVASRVAGTHGATTVEGAPVVVAMRADELERVLANLVTNALAAQPEHPRVAIAWRGGRIEVHDAGPGLAAWPRPFTSGRANGVGIGSVTVRLLVEGAGGSVEVTRSPRLGGACIVVELPVLEEVTMDERSQESVASVA